MSIHAQLRWLPSPPDDFKARARVLASDVQSPARGRLWQQLATHALDENQLHVLAKQFTLFRDAGGDIDPLTPLTVAIISNATTGFLTAPLIASALRHGVALKVVEGNFNQPMQDALEARSIIHQAAPDLVLFALDYRAFQFIPSAGNNEEAARTVTSAIDYIKTLRDGIRGNGKALCIFQTVARPAEPDFGSFDTVLEGTERALIAEFNRALAALVRDSSDLLFDVAGLAETVGLDAWHDKNLWYMAKQPFANDFLPIYSEWFARLLGAFKGKSRRVLVLDLDNTLWGGVIGDDGIEGIVVGQGNAVGEAHLAVQHHALSLRARGVVLAVSSKNTDEIARGPFQKHPEMALREEHIAVFQANWNDKATNIRAIASELNLGLDAFVFLDDNPVERGLVRQILPEVAVPELPADPALFVPILRAAGYFEAVAFSEEDRKRAEFYSQNAKRVSLQKQAGDIESYLRSLDMVMTISRFNAIGRARISQLCNKSNQYNLTTRRYTEADIATIETDATCRHWQIRLEDIYGDNGMISVIICRESDTKAWEIDTWLMSCRVLGRKVEEAALQDMLACARHEGITHIYGIYLPTERNGLVVEHYDKLGFTLVEQKPDGSKRYVLEVASAEQRSVALRIIHA